jgi:HSP20 family molecular chaperone IbpA
LQKQREQQQQTYQKALEERTKQEAMVRQEQRRMTLGKNDEFHKQRVDFEAQKKQEAAIAAEQYQRQKSETQREGEKNVKQVQQDYNQKINLEKQNLENLRMAQREHYEQEVQKEKDHYESQIRGRAGEYENEYNKNELKYQMVLEDQRLRYQEHYEKTKYQFLDKLKNYEKSQKDPFYRVQDLGAEMADNGPLYQVALKVPEHELKNIKVSVQPDRITVTGARKFEQELAYEGQKLATNNYQTMRQEFQLPVPADKDLVKREYVDGVLFVTAPKKGLGIF